MRGLRAGALTVIVLTAACGGPAEEAASDSPVPGAPILRASVGTEESPDAFQIALADADGRPVTELPAGEYDIEVEDRSTIHSFHLSGGDGAVDEKTGVREKGTTTWVVTFEPGQYRYLCDPHPSMHGSFTVT